MENQTPKTSLELIHQAQMLGFIGSKSTLTCSNCKAVFPYQYGNCPRCNLDQSFEDLKIDFEI